MAGRSQVDFGLGKTRFQDLTPPTDFGSTVSQEGAEAYFDNIDPATYNTQSVNLRNSTKRKARLVRNVSGGALLPGALVKWAANFHGKRVGAVTGAGDELAGIVDENLPAAGVQQNDLFWLIVEGETLCNKVSATVFADGAFLGSGASGQVVAAANIANDGSHVGRVIAPAANPSSQVLVHVKTSHS